MALSEGRAPLKTAKSHIKQNLQASRTWPGRMVLCIDGDRVSLTRSAEVAAYWALLERDNDEGRGAILIFDRQSLERRYKVEPNPEAYWHTNTLFHDEAEEEIWDDVIDIGNHLVGFVSGPSARGARRMPTLNRRRRTILNRELRTQIEARFLSLSLPDDPGIISKILREAQARSGQPVPTGSRNGTKVGVSDPRKGRSQRPARDLRPKQLKTLQPRLRSRTKSRSLSRLGKRS
jgi:hypothetical protein